MHKIFPFARVFRGGLSQSAWYREPEPPDSPNGPYVYFEVGDDVVHIRTDIASAGGGRSGILVELDPLNISSLLLELACSNMTFGPDGASVPDTLRKYADLHEEMEEHNRRTRLAIVPEDGPPPAP